MPGRGPDRKPRKITPSKKNLAIRAFIQAAIGYRGSDCLLWPFAKLIAGYGVVKNDGRQVSVHRLICETVYGSAPEGRPDAAHSCRVPACVNPRHLRWASHTENMADRVTHGTLARGAKQGSAKLTEKQVRWIRMQRHHSPSAVALEVGVTRQYITRIWQHKSWAWLS